jgi:hypothetical protein
MARNYLLFDLETTGKDSRQSSILSASLRTRTSSGSSSATSFYARPEPGHVISPWVKSQVWDPISKRADLASEEQLVKGFISTLESNKGKTLAGWNIQNFDLPFMAQRASRYGLQSAYQQALSGVTIRDLGLEYAYSLSKSLYRHKDVIDESLWRSIESYRNTGLAFEKQGMSSSQAAHQLARSGYKISGWKQQDAYELLTGKKYTAHQSAEDIAALEEIIGGKIPSSREFAIAWNKRAIQGKTIASAFSGAPAFAEQSTYYQELIARAKKYGITDIEEQIAAESAKKGGSSAALADIVAGKGYQEVLEKIGGKVGGGKNWGAQNLFRLGVDAAKSHPFALGGGILFAGALLTKPLQYISGNKDDYNTIEGLSHKGVAGRTRKQNTDFGSGWRGLLQSKSFRIGAGLTAGIGALAYGIHRLYGSEPEDETSLRYQSLIRHRFAGYATSLKKYGVTAGTGHKRILIPKSQLSEKDIQDLGFEGTLFAIPESGQNRLTSYRNPYNPYHLHSHGDNWSIHRDRHAALTMSLKKVWRDDDPFLTNVGQSIAEIPSGLAHIITEGIPGGYYWLKNKFSENLSMAEKIRREQGLRFSGKDDVYNTIEGLKHIGVAGATRRQNTDFGSGYQGQKEDKKESHFLSSSLFFSAGALAGFNITYPYDFGKADPQKYPRLRKLQEIGFQKGMMFLDQRLGSLAAWEEQHKPSLLEVASGKIIGIRNKEKWNYNSDKAAKFPGLVYNVNAYDLFPEIHYEGYENIKPQHIINYGEWDIGVNKQRTFEFFENKNQEKYFARNLPLSYLLQEQYSQKEIDYFSEEEQRKLLFESDHSKRIINENLATSNFVIKQSKSSLSEGVWFSPGTVPAKSIQDMLLNPSNYHLEEKLDLIGEFRSVTVGGKSIYTAHRWAPERIKKGLSTLEKYFPSFAEHIKAKHYTENIFPVLDRDLNRRLVDFTEQAARSLPKEIDIMAYDIGLTRGGEFKIIELQRTFGTLKNPIVNRRIHSLLTGKLSNLGRVGMLGAGILGALGAKTLFSGKDD